MDTPGYVKKYQEELKDEKKYSWIFNIWAFIFSSLYFVYKMMYLHFFIFFFAPLILAYVFMLLLGSDNAYLISLLITHTIAGFVANQHYKKYMQNYVNDHKDVDLSRVVSYDSISILKLVLCMVFSFGLYALYWGYQHWKKYQMTTKDDVSPFWRGWLIHLTAPFLFSKIGKSINSKIKLQYYGIGFLVCVCGLNGIDKYLAKNDVGEQGFVLFLLSLILFAISIWLLVIVQKRINEYNISQTNEKIKMNINIKEIIIVILSFVLIGVLPFAEGYNN